MKVLLLVPTHKYATVPELLSLSDFPSGIAYLAAALKQAGHEVIGCNPNNIIGYVDAPTMLKATLSKAVLEHKPELIGMGGLCTDYKFFRDAIAIIRGIDPKIPIVLGGNIVTNDAEDVFKILQPDYAVTGDGEKAIVDIANGTAVKGIIEGTPCIVDELPLPDYEPFGIQDMMDNYSNATRLLYRFSRENPRPYGIVTARGCPFSCLQGDTLIDTPNGLFPIKELVGKDGIKVLTRNKVTHEPEYALASMIAKTGENKKLIRVHFDDKSFIDCTRDHKFMVFKNRNQFGATIKEWEVEARNLKPSQSVRAIKYRPSVRWGYVDVEFGRYYSVKQHRLVMEGILGRKLIKGEWVHHKDHNRINNIADNLQLVSPKEHIGICHPEIAERMKNNNPMSHLDVRLRQAATQRERVASGEIVPFMCTDKGKRIIGDIARVRALSDMNPAKVKYREKLAREVNHKVVSVESLPYKEDVYCMEVPGYDWFFANGVLVHNCSFCIDHHRSYRPRSIEKIMEEIRISYEKYKFNILIILDELFAVNKERMIEFCAGIVAGKKVYGWDFDWMFQTHASAKLDLPTLQMAKEAGCVSFSYGLESASPAVLESMHKKIDPQEVSEAIKLAHEAKVGFSANLIFGDIAETRDTVTESLTWWMQNSKDAFVFLGTVVPYPGSELFESARKRGLFPDKKAYYEHVHEINVNLTTMPDQEWFIKQNLFQYLEGSWAFTKTAPAKNIELVKREDSYLKNTGGYYYRMTAVCPHCGANIAYVERLRDSVSPFWVGTGCVQCQKRVKIIKG